jgi:hypothetical protein
MAEWVLAGGVVIVAVPASLVLVAWLWKNWPT